MRASTHKIAGFGNERSLHSAVKGWIAEPGDRFEVEVDGFVVDIVRGDLLIEVQTRNFSAIRGKLDALVKKHKVRLVYPIAMRKRIVQVDGASGKPTRRRRSPKRGKLIDVFDELVRIPWLVKDANFELEVLLSRRRRSAATTVVGAGGGGESASETTTSSKWSPAQPSRESRTTCLFYPTLWPSPSRASSWPKASGSRCVWRGG